MSNFNLGEARGSEEAADEGFVVFQDVETVARGLFGFEGGVAVEGAGVDEAADEVEGRAVVPVKLVEPVGSFFVEEIIDIGGASLAKINEAEGVFHGWRGIITLPGAMPNYWRLF